MKTIIRKWEENHQTIKKIIRQSEEKQNIKTIIRKWSENEENEEHEENHYKNHKNLRIKLRNS